MSRLADLAIDNYMNQYVGQRPAVVSTSPPGLIVNRTQRSVDAPEVVTPPASTGPTTTDTPPPTTTNPGSLSDLAFGTPRGVAGTGYAGYNYAGFDFNQDAANRDIGKSAKYALANATTKMGQAGVTAEQWGTKAGAQDVATKYLVPEFESLGYKVLEVKGDKIRVVTFEDYQKGNTKGTWVDWVINADGAALGLTPQIGWQPETAPDATDPTTGWTPTATASTATGAKTGTTTGTGTGPDPTTPVSSAYASFVDDELMRGRSLADLVY